MKRLKIITTALTILFFVVSCKKQSADPAPTPVAVAKKLQSMTWAPGYGANESFTYDAQGRLTKEEDQYEIETYEYNGNTVHIIDYNKTKARIVEDVNGITDNAGRMISYTSNNTYTLNNPFTEQAEFTYDANGYLQQFKVLRPGQVYSYDFTVTDGDYTKLVYQLNGQGGYTQTDEYYTDKNDRTGISLNIPESFGFNNGLFGKPNTHLLKYEQLLQKGALIPSWTRSLSYTLDNEGYPLTLVLGGYWISSATYSFQ